VSGRWRYDLKHRGAEGGGANGGGGANAWMGGGLLAAPTAPLIGGELGARSPDSTSPAPATRVRCVSIFDGKNRRGKIPVRTDAKTDATESLLRVHWVAVPDASRARRVNRRSHQRPRRPWRRLRPMATSRRRRPRPAWRPPPPAAAPPPPPIDAPCTRCLRHGDPMHAQK
jgi:hypothetical protein